MTWAMCNSWGKTFTLTPLAPLIAISPNKHKKKEIQIYSNTYDDLNFVLSLCFACVYVFKGVYFC